MGAAGHRRSVRAAWQGNPDATLANYRAGLAALVAGVAPRNVPVLAEFLDGYLGLRPLAAYRRLVGTVFSSDIFDEHAAGMLRTTIREARRHPASRSAILAWSGAEFAEATVVAYRRTGRAAWVSGWLELAPLRPEILDRVLELLVAHRRDYLEGAWFGRPTLARGYAYCLGGGTPGNVDLDP